MDNFRLALKGESHDSIPVWYMRQAGRYLPGYTSLRKRYSMKNICRNPDLTVQITREPLDAIGVDAAIIFSDIMLPLEAMGFNVEFLENIGPVVSNNLSSNPDLTDIICFDQKNYSYSTYDSIRKFVNDVPDKPIIGFSGGPLTTASYVVAGKPDRDLQRTKKALFNGDRNFLELLNMIVDMIIENAKGQWKAGASAIQIFDSWAGYLSPDQLRIYSERFLTPISTELHGKVPTIYFSTRTSAMVNILEEAGFDFLSLDWTVDLHSLQKYLKSETGLQGNLDPVLISEAPEKALREGVKIAGRMSHSKKYIFNLGHGILPNTSPEALRSLTDSVHSIALTD